MAINGNRILGSISENSYVLCLARTMINGQNVFFLPLYDLLYKRLVWVSATDENLPSVAEAHSKWYVFKQKTSTSGKFIFESFLTDLLLENEAPIFSATNETLETARLNIDGKTETVLASLPKTNSLLNLSVTEDVILSKSKLWAGVWYKTNPKSGIAAAKISGTKGWAGLTDLANIVIYKNVYFSFIPCFGIQQSVTAQCFSHNKYFTALTFVREWVKGNQNYLMTNCDKLTDPNLMNCLFTSSIEQEGIDTPKCNGFRGYMYGSRCKNNEYADVCGPSEQDNCGMMKCMYDANGSLACREENEPKQRISILGMGMIVLAIVLAIVLIVSLLK